MSKRQSRRSKVTNLNPRTEMFGNIVFTVLCVLGTGVAIFLFLRNLNTTMTQQNESPIGYILFKNRIVQRRFGNRTAWTSLKNNSPIYNKDVIHTADLSEAVVVFPSGDRIELGENSLVQIQSTKDGARLELTSGNINVQSAEESTLTLVSAGVEVKVEAGSLISADVSEESSFNMQVVEGAAGIATDGGILQNAEAGTAMSVASDGEMTRRPSVTMIQPRPNVRTINQDNTPVPFTFSWRTANFSENEQVRLEIARDSRFTRLANRFDIETDVSNQTVELTTGTWYWRAYPSGVESSNADVVASGKITIIVAPTLTAVSPAAGKIFTYKTNPPSIRFNWEASAATDASVSYQFLISDNPQMLNPIYSVDVTGNSILYSGVTEGAWYWQVRPMFPDGFEAETTLSAIRPSPFHVSKIMTLNTPELLLPVDGADLAAPSDGADLFFSWKNEPEAVSYTVQISASRDMNNPVISQQTRDNFFIYSPRENILQAGRYFWRVSYQDADGLIAPVSPSWAFTVTIPPPAPDYQANLARAIDEIERARVQAIQNNWDAALTSYRNAGTDLGFSEAQNTAFIEGISAFRNLDELESLYSSLSVAETANQDYTAHIEELNRQIVENSEEIARLNQDMINANNDFDAQNAASLARITDLETRAVTLESENGRLQQLIQDLEAGTVVMRQGHMDREAFVSEQIGSLRSRISELSTENARLRQEVQDAATVNSAQTIALQSRISELEAENARLQQTDRIAALQSRISELEAENARLRQADRTADLQNRVSELEAENVRLQQTSMSESATAASLRERIDQLEIEREQLTQTLQESDRNLTEMTNNYNRISPEYDAYIALQEAFAEYKRRPMRLPELETFLKTREVRASLPDFADGVKTVTDNLVYAANKEGIDKVSSIVTTVLRIENMNTRRLYLEGIKARYIGEPLVTEFIDILLQRL
ncbi:MAG: FecR domain-containing protein [Treponema sp.]|jgi:predicted nuclease with TOPRIM domain|nr:FecR domain-containing protein [Treponema sp.]